MSFLDRLFSWNGSRAAPAQDVRPQNSYPITSITNGSAAWDDFFNTSGSSNYPSEATAFTVSAIYACVNLYAGAIASLVKHIYRVQPDGERDRVLTDPLWWVLNEEMAPRWSAANGWEFMIQSLLLHGDGFARIIRDRQAMPIGLKPMHPTFVEVALNTETDRLVYIYSPTELAGKINQRLVIDQDDVVHIAGFGFDGFRGMSPLRYSLREAGAVAMSAQRYSNAFFGNSARPDFALTTDQKLSAESIENLRSQLAENHQGVEKSFKPMVLQGGLDIKTITMPVTDIQLIETRQFQIEEIARIYGVPPFMIGYNEKTTSWGSGVEAMGTGFVRFSLRQHLNKIETELNRKLFRTAAKRVEFDTFDLERADMKSMFEAFRIGIGRAGEPGFISVQEARMRLNMKRKPDGELNPGTTAPAAPNDPTQVTP
jgi:HK97 family phage portal protein